MSNDRISLGTMKYVWEIEGSCVSKSYGSNTLLMDINWIDIADAAIKFYSHTKFYWYVGSHRLFKHTLVSK